MSDHTEKASSLRIPDLADMYLPYLLFNYSVNSTDHQHTASLGLFHPEYYLPVNPAVDFLPSRDGFRFANSFSGYFLPYSTPAFMTSRKISSKYGLCGGMCAAAYDLLLAGRPVPREIDVPRQGSRLQRYLFRRQMDSLGGLGQQAIKVAQWTSLPDGTPLGTMRRTADEFASIRNKLDAGNLVVLALIYEHATSIKQLSKLIFSNHQVLAYGYQQDITGSIEIRVYDPNLPARDDVMLRCKPVELNEQDAVSTSVKVTGYQTSQLVGGEHHREVRGFFEMPYAVVKPPEKI